MSLKSSLLFVKSEPYNFNSLYISPLVGFSLFLFLINLGDAVMSYLAPVYITKFVSSPLIMGCIMALSSLVGFLCDIFIPKIFPNRRYSFYSWFTIINALTYTLIFLLFPSSPFFFILAMIFWGIYYEFLRFSHFSLIKKFVPQNEYSQGWGISTAFRSAAYLIGPLIAVFALSSGFHFSFFVAALIYLSSAFGLFIFSKTFSVKSATPPPSTVQQLSLVHILSIWKILWRKIWPLYIFIFILTLVDSAFWTIGALLSEQLRHTSTIAGFLLPAYALPSLFIGLLAKKASKPSGKKRAAFISALLGGLLLIPVGLVSSAPVLIFFVFVSSIFYSLAFPEIYAVFEDYVKRLGPSGDEMVGLQSSAICLSYIIGPVIAGGLASLVGIHSTFTILGGLVAIYSLTALFYVPRKIRLPQTELSHINTTI